MKNKKKLKQSARDVVPPEEPSEEVNKPLGFMDLSAELRNTIYELCLTSTKKIIIHRSTRSQAPMGWLGRYGMLGNVGQTDLYFSNTLLCPNLLATCKSIHEEATPVLYGSNQFVLRPDDSGHAERLRPFTLCIGSSVKHIRNIEITRAANKRTIASILKSLEVAKSLRTLKADFRDNFFIARTMAAALYPLILQIHQSRKDTDQPAALDMLEFPPSYIGDIGTWGDMSPVKGILEKRLIRFDKSSAKKK